MLTCNFNRKYIEIALYKMDIEECNHFCIIELIEYLHSIPKYSVYFPEKFAFLLPNGKKDDSYQAVEKSLVNERLFTKDQKFLKLSERGKKFFAELEKLCLETESTFLKYYPIHC